MRTIAGIRPVESDRLAVPGTGSTRAGLPDTRQPPLSHPRPWCVTPRGNGDGLRRDRILRG